MPGWICDIFISLSSSFLDVRNLLFIRALGYLRWILLLFIYARYSLRAPMIDTFTERDFDVISSPTTFSMAKWVVFFMRCRRRHFSITSRLLILVASYRVTWRFTPLPAFAIHYSPRDDGHMPRTGQRRFERAIITYTANMKRAYSTAWDIWLFLINNL